MPLVGDPQRDLAVGTLRRAYADGTLRPEELDRRVELALRARSATQLAGSVRGIPGGVTQLAVEGLAVPAVRYGTFGLRLRLARLLLGLAFGGWLVATVLIGLVAAVWTLAAGLSLGVGVSFLVVWIVVSAGAYCVSRGARRIARL